MTILKEKITDLNIIKKLIPQREPIIMVDALVAFEDKKITSEFTIKKHNMFVKNNLFTESGIIEHMAQTVALYTGYHFFINNKKPPEGYIGAIKNVHLYKLPKINDTLQTEVTILQEIMGVTLVKGTTKRHEDVIMTAEMKTVLKS